MNCVTVAEKRSEMNRNETISKICFMLSANTGEEITREIYCGVSTIVEMLENQEAQILSPHRLKRDDVWVIAQAKDNKPLINGSVFDFATLVFKDEPFEKEIIDTYFAILKSSDLDQTYRVLSESRLMLNYEF